MKKAVMKLDLHDDKNKQKAMKIVSGLSGVDSITVDMKDQKLTVTGNIDPVIVASKLRKLCVTDIVSVGPAKEEAKKPPEEKTKGPKDEWAEYWKAHLAQQQAYPTYMPTYYVRSVEENPNGCVIC